MKEVIGKERVWLWGDSLSFSIRNSKGKYVNMPNLQEAIIIKKESDDVIKDWYNYKLKIGSTYYTLEDIDEFDYFLTQNPFKKYKYDKKTWDAIKDGRIEYGMTQNQVILSWGSPDDRNTYGSSYYGSTEQWIYGNVLKSATYLYFYDGELTSWQMTNF